MSNLEDVGHSFELSVARENLFDLMGDLADANIERILDVGDFIPIFSYFSKGFKATIAVRDMFFMEKVISFMRGVAALPDKERQKMVAKIQEDEKYRIKFGKFSLIALERFDDDAKAKYLANAAIYLARQDIDFDQYQRFSHIIDRLSIADLDELIDDTRISYISEQYSIFESLGLFTSSLKLVSESERKIAWKTDPNTVRVSHRRMTSWGNMTKNMILNLPIEYKK